MTEKRFMIDDAGTLIDMQTRNTYDYVSDVCGLLNELTEEKEQLKHDATVLICSNQEYRKENEQLKCGNKNLKNILNDFINICNRLQANPADKQTLNVARDMLQNMGVDVE